MEIVIKNKQTNAYFYPIPHDLHDPSMWGDSCGKALEVKLGMVGIYS